MARTRIAPSDIRTALATAEVSALTTWRDMVLKHADGKPVDLAELARISALIGVVDPAVEFAADVESVMENRRLLNQLEEERKDFAHAVELATEAEQRVWELRAEVAQCEQAISLPQIMAHGVSAISARAASIRRTAPRMFIEQTAADDATTGSTPDLAGAWLTYRKRAPSQVAVSVEFEVD